MADIARLGIIAQLPDPGPRRTTLEIGSDVEIASRVLGEIRLEFGHIVFAEGQFYVWRDGLWRTCPESEFASRILFFDGVAYPTSNGEGRVRLGRQRIQSVLFVMRTAAADPEFFHHPAIGINCESGFIEFDANGQPHLQPHSPGHRQRHKLAARWRADQPPAPGPLLAQLLAGCLRGDTDLDEKTALLAEVAGAAALGIGTRLKAPKAILLYGPSAANGKSQILNMLRALLPPAAVRSVPPRKFGDDRHVVRLVGALLNTVDELGDATVFSEQFKAIITGDRISGRDVYKAGLDFRPVALHVLAGNRFPGFTNGMDAGVRRRVLVVSFNRTIPEDERVEDIGSRIGVEEADQLLAWAVCGAACLLKRGDFPDLASSREAVAEWILAADSIGGWLSDSEQVTITKDPGDQILARAAYGHFRAWCETEGIQRIHVPQQASFTQRVATSGRGIEKVRSPRGALLRGLRITRGGRS